MVSDLNNNLNGESIAIASGITLVVRGKIATMYVEGATISSNTSYATQITNKYLPTNRPRSFVMNTTDSASSVLSVTTAGNVVLTNPAGTYLSEKVVYGEISWTIP